MGAKNDEFVGATGRSMLKMDALTAKAKVMQALRGRYRAKVTTPSREASLTIRRQTPCHP